MCYLNRNLNFCVFVCFFCFFDVVDGGGGGVVRTVSFEVVVAFAFAFSNIFI